MRSNFARLSGFLSLISACGGGQVPPASTPPSAAETAPIGASSSRRDPSPYPAAAKRPVVTTYHGTKVADDYQWLENAADANVKLWISAENELAREQLDAQSGRPELHARIKEILSSASADRFALSYAGGQLFAVKDQPPKQQAFLVVLNDADDLASERVIVDPNVIDSSGGTTIDYYEPSPDGARVAVSLSEGGTESGTVHVFDTKTGKKTGDVVPFANSGTAGGALTWAKDGKGFFYTRHPHPGERPSADMGFFQQVYFHVLGTATESDAYSVGKDFPRIAEIELETSDDGKYVLANVKNGDGGESALHLLDTRTGKWSELAALADKVVHASFGADGKIYALSLKGAPRGQILRIDPLKPVLAQAQLLVPETAVTIQSAHATKSTLYVRDLVGGPSAVRMFDLKGKARGELAIPAISAVREVVRLRGDDILFRGQSYTEMPAWYRYSAKGGVVAKTKLELISPVSFADIEVTREMVTSKDGTQVPLNILKKKGTALNGTHPAILTGYGGYGISMQPRVNPLLRVWFDRGGVFAVANLRGGGELGEEWHLAGNLTKKQNVFDDFYACAKYLVATQHTSSTKLGILGGSNGGLLMGAALTQHPEMYKAVVSLVGIYDMLRVELSPNGAFNVTEYGTVKDPDHFRALLAYSPLHNVKDNTAYPAVLFITGANDPRVDPMHSRKMTARLQAASTGGTVLLRADDGQGHGGGTPLSAEIDQAADYFGFFINQLGAGPNQAPPEKL